MLLAGLNNVFGPCLNIIPVRIKMDDAKTLEHALTCTQQQRLSGMDFEASTTPNILKTCTDWPAHLRKYTYTVLFQLSETLAIDPDEAGPRLDIFGPPGPFESEEGVLILATPGEKTWEITISGNARFCAAKDLADVLDELVAVLQRV